MRDDTPREALANPVLQLAAVVLRRWRLVLLVAAVTTAAATITSVLTPPQYVAATVMVPFTASGSRGGLGMAQLPAGMASLVGGAMSPASERLVGVVLRSQTLADSMTKRLAPRYVAEGELRRILQKGTRVQRNPDGSVVVQVRARDPRLAARIANTYPVLVNELMVRVSGEGARRKQGFLEAQLTTARERLVNSEQQMLEFQRGRGAADVEEQARRTLDAAGQLNQQVFEAERRLAELRRTLAPGHPRLQAAEADLATLRGQLRRVTAGGGGGPMYVPLGQGGELRLASARLLREFAQEEQVYQALTAALAETQMDANNNLPVLSVLDPAQVPGPSGSLPRTAVLAAVLGGLLGAALALASDAFSRARANPENAAFFTAWDQFLGDLRLGRRRGRGLAAGD